LLGSAQELQDLRAAYLAMEGSIDGIFERIPHSNYTDEDRFITIINESIKCREIPSFPRWKKELADQKAKVQRRKAGEKEAKEAEAAAKELGVWEELYKDKPNSSSGKAAKDGEEDYSTLKALIQGKKRKTDDFLDNLAAKYTNQSRGKSGNGERSNGSGRGRKKAKRS
jgi:DnaJ family protein C protein 9